MTPLLDLPLREAPLAFVDVETTGLSPEQGHRVVEIAVVRAQGPEAVASFARLVNPQRPISAGARRVNGITAAMVADQPTFAEIWPDVLPLLEDAVIVAHNAPFDLGFLSAELERTGAGDLLGRQQALLRQAEEVALCTLALARRQYYFFSNSLTNIARSLNISQGGARAHRALDDVETTRAVFHRFSGDLTRRSRPLVRDWLRMQGGPLWRVPPASPRVPAPPAAPAALSGDPIQRALALNQRLHIRYRSGKGGVTERTIQPLQLTGDYLVAYCHLRQEERTFRLDRIIELRPEEPES